MLDEFKCFYVIDYAQTLEAINHACKSGSEFAILLKISNILGLLGGALFDIANGCGEDEFPTVIQNNIALLERQARTALRYVKMYRSECECSGLRHQQLSVYFLIDHAPPQRKTLNIQPSYSNYIFNSF